MPTHGFPEMMLDPKSPKGYSLEQSELKGNFMLRGRFDCPDCGASVVCNSHENYMPATCSVEETETQDGGGCGATFWPHKVVLKMIPPGLGQGVGDLRAAVDK